MLDERVTDEYLRRPEVTVGYAMVGPQGDPYPSTVADSERAAAVNALVAIFGQMVVAGERDAVIMRRFQETGGHRGFRISPVLIEAVVEVPETESE